MVKEIINLYGAEVLGTLLIALFGIFGMALKRMAEKVLDTPVKQRLAKIAVQFAEQVYRNLHGEQKLNAALGVLAELLAEKKIYATQKEMTVLLEAAVAEFNDVFHKAGAEHTPAG